MNWTNAKIEEAFIGIEDHGIFAWGITFTGDGWGQGTRMRFMSEADLPKLKTIVTHFGPWNKMTGKLVRIGRESDRGPILAIRDIIDDTKEIAL